MPSAWLDTSNSAPAPVSTSGWLDTSAPATAPKPAAPAPVPKSSSGWLSDAIDYTDNAIQAASQNPIVRGLQGVWNQGVAEGPIMNGMPNPFNLAETIPGVRQGMETMGIGRQQGESDASLHARYNAAAIRSRQQGQQEAQDNQVGAYDGNPLHMAERFGQQAVNTGASFASNPQNFLLPGTAFGGNLAARLGTAALGNAAIGSASDAAAQLSDMAEGIKKDFDVSQNIQSTLTAGVGGALLHGAFEAAPFVKNLFANRGMDTKPAADPRDTTQPMTSNNVVLNPADQGQYRDLLRSGSVDDIKNFLATKQGPKPSYQDVNAWVTHRDAAQPMDTVPKPVQDTVQRLMPQGAEDWRQQVEQHINNQTTDWKNAPTINVVHGPEDITNPEVRASALSEDTKGTARGMYGSDGQAYIFSGRIGTPEVANAALYHEALGHFGLDQVFGSKLTSTMQSMYDRNVGNIRKVADKYMSTYKGTSPALAAEEAIVKQGEAGPLKPVWHQAVLSIVRQFGRSMGMKLSYSDGEVMHILSMAHDAVINGKVNARANGYSTGNNKFMFTGPHASGFNPFDKTAFVGSDLQMRNEISDRDATLNGHRDPHSGAFIMHGDTLGEVLNHPKLFQQYPELRDLPVTQHQDYSGQSSGHYDTGDATVGKHINIVPQRDPLGSVLHETQHAIQHIEQSAHFMRAMRNGGTAAEGMHSDAYWNHPSEIEARDTDGRKSLTDLDRQVIQPAKFMRYPDDPETEKAQAESARRFSDFDAPTHKMSEEMFVKLWPTVIGREDLRDIYNRYGMHGLLTIAEEARQSGSLKLKANPEWQKFDLAARNYQEAAQRHSNWATQPYRDALEKELPPGFQIKRDYRYNLDAGTRGDGVEENLMVHGPNGEEIAPVSAISNGTWARMREGHIPQTPANDTGLPRYNKYMQGDDEDSWRSIASEAFDRLEQGFDNRGPSRSWDDAIAAAKNTALDTAKLQKTHSVGDLDKRLFQYNGAAKELNDRLMASAEKITAGTPLTAEEHADRVQDVAQFHYVLGRIEQDSSQIARALNAMKAIEFSRNHLLSLKENLADADSTLEGLADPDNMNKFLKQYQILGKTKGGQLLIRDLSKPGWEKYALTLYRNMLLSGISTHVKAPQDMLTGIALDLEDRLGAIPLGKLHDALQAMGITKQGGMHGREPLGYLYGALRAVWDGTAWSKAIAALRDPHSQTLRVSSEAPAVLPGLTGQITTIPTRLIAAQDAFFRAISTNAHLYGAGIAKSIGEGGKGMSFIDHIDRGVSYGQNPDAAMLKDAKTRANSALLLSENPITKFLERGKRINTGSDPIDRGITAAIDLITPIIRVPANSLLSRVIARSPISYLDPETRAMFHAGGRQFDIAMSRTLMGTLKLALMWSAAGVTGNLLKGDNRKEAEASGWRSNAVHENGTYETGNQLAQSVVPWDMHNSTATMVADIRAAYDQGANQGQIGTAFKGASSRLMHDTFDQLWMGDISHAMGIFSDSPADSGTPTRVVGNLVSGAVVPSAVEQFRAFTDDNQHDTQVPDSISGTLANDIQARIPGLSNSLPIRYSVYGDPLKSGQNFIGSHNWLGGGNRVPETTDPVEKELDRLNNSLAGLKQETDHKWPATLVTPVKKTLQVNGEDKKLTPAEFENYQRLAGHYIVEDMRQEMSTPEWQQMTDHDRVLLVKSIESSQKANAKEELFGQ